MGTGYDAGNDTISRSKYPELILTFTAAQGGRTYARSSGIGVRVLYYIIYISIHLSIRLSLTRESGGE